MIAEHRFDAALRDLVDAGVRPPCAYDAELWFADHADDRAEAARACLRCPLLDDCRDRTAEIRPLPSDGIWAGIDLSIPARRRDAAAQARRRATRRSALPDNLTEFNTDPDHDRGAAMSTTMTNLSVPDAIDQLERLVVRLNASVTRTGADRLGRATDRQAS